MLDLRTNKFILKSEEQMKKTHFFALSVLILSFFSSILIGQLGPTVTQSGLFSSVSPSNVVSATINGNYEEICLPQIDFLESADVEAIRKTIAENLRPQEAIFHLYHDGLGRPLKKAEMYYASDFYLKELKTTYSGFLRQIAGPQIKISTTPPHQDPERMKTVLYDSFSHSDSKEKDEKKKSKEKEERTKWHVTTMYDVLPHGVFPPSVRREQAQIEKILQEIKAKPYQEEVVEVPPLRWASGKFSTLKPNGDIPACSVEGQKIDVYVNVPNKANWLSPQMIKELQNQNCEFILQRDINGIEVKNNNRYYARDLFFTDLKLSWEEWLSKYDIEFSQPDPAPSYASAPVKLSVDLIKGEWQGYKASVLCKLSFDEPSKLVAKNEIFRILPPTTRPPNFAQFIRLLDSKIMGKQAQISMLICPNGQPYTELGQKRAQRIYFPDFEDTLDGLLNKAMKGKLK